MKLVTDGTYYKGVGRDRVSPHYGTEYKDGAEVIADRLSLDTSTECDHGIHICETVAQALRWGPVVLRVSVPARGTMVRAGSKLRVDRVTVISLVDLSSADLGSANLRSADLRYADLGFANLGFADLRSADLRFANLRSANLGFANLRYADLRSANLRYADLGYANLRSANLGYADLGFANLGFADLRYADLRYATSTRRTLWPEGFDVAAAGVRVVG